jgi:hypothetical protein
MHFLAFGFPVIVELDGFSKFHIPMQQKKNHFFTCVRVILLWRLLLLLYQTRIATPATTRKPPIPPTTNIQTWSFSVEGAENVAMSRDENEHVFPENKESKQSKQ